MIGNVFGNSIVCFNSNYPYLDAASVCVEPIDQNRVNIHNLRHNSPYRVEVYATNAMGTSGSSNLLTIKTSDLTDADAHLLPVFTSLLLDVPRNRLEFTTTKAR